ncbi:MAG: TIGR03619 family F420-dependent LLM class oxidoreductase [Acidimicrobiales bacterium]
MRFTIAVAMTPAEQYLPIARAADAAGWSGIAVPDSPFFPEVVAAKYHYTDDGSRYWTGDTPFLDPFVAIAAMAAVTQRLRFLTMVLKLPIRHPLLVAKTVGSLSALAGPSRVALGVGLSWIPEEFAWLGEDFESRGPRTDEAIAVIRELLAGGMVEHHGAHYDFAPLQMSPAASGPVPIIVGGHSKPALRRAARLGDGWVSANLPTTELIPIIERLREGLEAEGRAGEPFEIIVIPTDVFDADGFARLAELGVTEAITQPWWFYGGDADDLQVRIDSIERFAQEVIGLG